MTQKNLENTMVDMACKCIDTTVEQDNIYAEEYIEGMMITVSGFFMKVSKDNKPTIFVRIMSAYAIDEVYNHVTRINTDTIKNMVSRRINRM